MIAMLSRKLLIIAAVDQILAVVRLQLGSNANGLRMTINTPAHSLQISICFA